MTISFGDITGPEGLKELNEYLHTRSYIDGYVASRDDLAVFVALHSAPDSSSYPNAARWYSHVKALLGSSFPGAGKGVKLGGKSSAEHSGTSALHPSSAPVPSATEHPPAKSVFPSVPKGGSAAGPTEVAAAHAKPAAAPVKLPAAVEAPMEDDDVDDDDDDEDLELFTDLTPEEQAAADEKKRIIAEAKKRGEEKAKKTKSMIILDVKPWDDTTDLAAMEKEVRSIQKDGLLWGSSKLVPVGYGIKKLQITCVIEDAKVESMDAICEEELVKDGESETIQSIDVVAFNKL